MGCPTEARLGERIVFSICTHDPETGGLADADKFPLYNLYRDEIETPFQTGTMIRYALGFYARSITCTQVGTYTVHIEATVSGETGGISYAFVVRTTPAPVVAEADSSDDTNAGELGLIREMCANILTEVEQIKDRPESVDTSGDDALIAAHLARLG